MTLSKQWLPRSIECLHGYTARKFSHDLVAGLTVGLVALPLAMAFAIASGVTPQAGLYTAVVAGFLISALGGSRTQIGGPTGAFVVIVAGIVVKFGVAGLALVGVMAGVLLLIMGFTGLGTAVKFIPRPVTIGFTNGIALLIASTQIKDFLGLTTPPVPSEFLPRIRTAAPATRAPTRWQTVAISATSLAIILFWPRITKRLPGSIVALLLSTAAVALFHLPDRDHRQQIRRHPARLSALHPAQLPRRAHPPAASLRLHGRPSRRSRKPALRRRRRWHERRSPQLQRRTRSPGSRQHRLASLRRHTRHRRHRPHRNQHPLRRAHAQSPEWSTPSPCSPSCSSPRR